MRDVADSILDTAIVTNEVLGTSFGSFSHPIIAALGMSYGSNTWRFRNCWLNRTCHPGGWEMGWEHGNNGDSIL